MQMNALRSANFAKLSSNRSTSDEYWVTSMSAGTLGGYCLSQIRSMDLSPQRFSLVVCMRVPRKAGPALFSAVWQGATIWQAAARYRRIGISRAKGVYGGKAAEKHGQGVFGQPAGLGSGLGFAVAAGLVAAGLAAAGLAA